MRRVLAAKIEVETCTVHGVWFDAGDLRELVHAVAAALGKPVPSVVPSLEAKPETPAAAPASSPVTQGPPKRPSEPSDLEIAARIASDAASIVIEPIEAVADVVLFPFRVVGLLSELID